MCEELHDSSAAVTWAAPRAAPEPPAERILLEPVDSVILTALVDNVSDLLLLDQGPAKRVGVISTAGLPRIAERLFERGRASTRSTPSTDSRCS